MNAPLCWPRLTDWTHPTGFVYFLREPFRTCYVDTLEGVR